MLNLSKSGTTCSGITGTPCSGRGGTLYSGLPNELEKTDKQIDQMIYELYNLTEEEIKIVEEATS